MDDNVREFTKDMCNELFEKLIDVAAEKIFNTFKSGKLSPDMDGAGPGFANGGLVDPFYVPKDHIKDYIGFPNESFIPKSAYNQLMSAGKCKDSESDEDIKFIRTIAACKALGGDIRGLESKKRDCDEPCDGCTCGDKDSEPKAMSWEKFKINYEEDALQDLIKKGVIRCLRCGCLIKHKDDIVTCGRDVDLSHIPIHGPWIITGCISCNTEKKVEQVSTEDAASLWDDPCKPASTKDTAKMLIDKYLGERIIDRSMMGAGEIMVVGVKESAGVVCLIGEGLNYGSYVIDPSGADVSIVPGDE